MVARRRNVFTVIVAVIVVGAVLVLRRSESGRLNDSRVTPATAQTRSDSQAQLEELPADHARSVHTDALHFAMLPGLPAEHRLRLVHAGTLAPVLGAEVFALELGSKEWADDIADVEARLRGAGHGLICDSTGRVRLPDVPQRVAVFARKGSLFGATTVIHEDRGEQLLELREVSSMRVRVRDSSGSAASGVRVTLRRGNRKEPWSGLTDDAGEAVVPNVEYLIADHEITHDGSSCVLVAEDGTNAPPQRWFATGEPFPALVELVIGDTRPLVVRVVAHDGTRTALSGTVTLDVWGGKQEKLGVGIRNQRPDPSAELQGGEARFARVGIGARMGIEVDLAGGASTSQEVCLPSDRAVPPEIVVRLAESAQVLRAHIVDADGAALANRELIWNSFGFAKGSLLQQDDQASLVRTDAQGDCTWVIVRDLEEPVVNDDPDKPAEAPLSYCGRLGTFSEPVRLSGERIDLDSLAAGAVLDLGSLRLVPEVPIARGRVVDERGIGIDGAEVQVHQLAVVDGELKEVSIVGWDWTPVRSDGSFELFGECLGGDLRLAAWSPAHTDLSEDGKFCEVPCGSARPCELRLVRDGGFTASLRVDDELDLERLTWTIPPKGYTLTPDRQSDANGLVRLEFFPVTAGMQHLLLRRKVDDEDHAILVADIEVRSGELTVDPRLQEIDLRGKLAAAPAITAPAVVLRVIDENGDPLSDGTIVHFGPDNASEHSWHGGRVDCTDVGGDHCLVWSPGCGVWSGTYPEISTTIQLGPALHARVHFDVPAEIRRMDGWHVLLCDLRLRGSWDLSMLVNNLGIVELDEHGDALIELPGPCEVDFVLYAQHVDASGRVLGDDVNLVAEEGLTIEVEARAGEQRFELHPTAAEWAAMLRKMKDAPFER